MVEALHCRTAMIVRVKICGITSVEDAHAAVRSGADALGFVFVPGTPRAVTAHQAATIIRALPPFISRVGLFVDTEVSTMLETARISGVDTVQLHGDELPETCQKMRQFLRVLKAFRVRGPETLRLLEDFIGVTDAFLLDAFVPGVHGGTGARFDWAQAVEAKALGHPLVLAGGLNPNNVADAVGLVGPYAVDVSSGVELAPGRKDPEKVRNLIEAVRKAGFSRSVG